MSGKHKVSETDMALISVSRALIDVLMAADIVDVKVIDRLLEIHQTGLAKQGYAIAGGILGAIRHLANDPTRQRQREEIRKLIVEQSKGSA